MLKQSVNFKLPVGKAITKMTKQKFNGLMKDKLGGKTMDEFVGSSAKTYSCLINNSCEN